MAGRLAGKTVVVTGAGRGIGAALSLGMAADGAAVVVTDQDDESVAVVAESIRDSGGRTLAMRADVTSRADTTNRRRSSTSPRRYGNASCG
jgi:meso-butanediol dehydrogenase/(S,S)-butanediol dehydrogenase/diacetyl reductase